MNTLDQIIHQTTSDIEKQIRDSIFGTGESLPNNKLSIRWIVLSASDEPDVKVLKISLKFNKDIYTHEARFDNESSVDLNKRFIEVSDVILNTLTDAINTYLNSKDLRNDCKDIMHALMGETYIQKACLFPPNLETKGCENVTATLFDDLRTDDKEPFILTNIHGFDRETAYHVVLESLKNKRDVVTRLQDKIEQQKEIITKTQKLLEDANRGAERNANRVKELEALLSAE